MSVPKGLLNTSVFIALESGRPMDVDGLPEEGVVSPVTVAELQAGATARRGNGGLEWAVVEPLIHRALGTLPDVEVHVYAPGATPQAAVMPNRQRTPTMTPGRAAFVSLLAHCSRMAMADPSLIEAQKLMYFLQKAVEGHYISGFEDGTGAVRDAEPLTVLPGAGAEAWPVLSHHPATGERIERVMALVEGFESARALELLATVHWALDQ